MKSRKKIAHTDNLPIWNQSMCVVIYQYRKWLEISLWIHRKNMNKQQSEKLTISIANMIVIDYLLGPGEGFTELANTISPGFNIQSRNTAKSRIGGRKCMKIRKKCYSFMLDNVKSVSNKIYCHASCLN